MALDKLVDSSQLDADLTSVANAIRTRGGTSASLAFPSGFVSAIGAIPGGAAPSGTLSITSNGIYDVASFASADVNVSGGGSVGSEDIKKLIAREAYSISNSEITTIGSYAFYNYQLLTAASFPNCETIGSYAFQSCSSVSTISFPKVSCIYDSAFASCIGLTEIYFPEVSTVNPAAFSGCTRVSRINLPKAISIYSGVFARCTSLTDVSLPEATGIGSSAFLSCSALLSIHLPKLMVIHTGAFGRCYSLSVARFDGLNKISSTYAFQYCYHLLSLYLLGSSVCSLVSATAFASTPISTYTTSTGGVRGSIFVRESLYSKYLSATNWATYSARIVSMTDAQIAALDGGT